MSDPVTALNGAQFSGALAEVAEAPLQGMITLRADLAVTAVKKALKTVTGCAMPGPGAIVAGDAYRVAWMSPDEVLVLCPYVQSAATVAQLQEALVGTHALVVDVSDARALFELSGGKVREVVSKLAPVDMSPQAFGAGTFRRTRLAQSAAAIWMDDTGIARIICFRSGAEYMFQLLRNAAH